MKRIRKSRAARILTWLLTVAMITPLLSGMVAPRAAHAQQAGTAAGGVQTVFVVDFVNKSGFGGDALARFATDQVVNELGTSTRFEVLKRDEVTRAAGQLGLRPPFDNVALTKLASQLGATGVITGEVSKVWVDAKTSPKMVSVGLKVRVLEATSADVVNGAAVIGDARAKPGESDDQALALEAATNASTLAVREILQYSLPEGIILYSLGQQGSMQVVINRGSRDGVKEGMEMMVLRDRQRVGKIRVTRVFPTDSEAAVIDNALGLRPEDRIRAVFPMPDFDSGGRAVARQTRSGGRNSSLKTLASIATIAVLGFVIAEAVRGKQQTVTGVVAEPTLVGNAPAIRVVWRDSMWGQGARVLEYHIWRSQDAPFSPTGTPVAAVGSETHQFIDPPTPTGWWDGTRSFLRPVFPPTTDAGEAESVTPDAGVVGPPRVGIPYIYTVSSVIRQVSTSTDNQGGQTNAFNDIESTPVISGQATMLPQPQPSTPADQQQNVDIRGINFTWPSIAGADEFVVEITTLANRDFKNRNLILQIPVFSTAPFASGVPQTLTQALNLTTNSVLRRDPAFLAWVTGTPGAGLPTLVWRVGARNSQDRPGPVHWITNNPHDSDRTFRYIYSVARTLTPAVLPPPPP